MIKSLLAAALAFAITHLCAQGIPVSHAPEKKNAVLEEYTGIHCTYCPDGHKIAKELHDAHPNDVVLMRFHAGTYAIPNAGEPDFRTSAGEYLANQSGLTGYPAASVNRHVFQGWAQAAGETAMGRSYWTAAAEQILTQDAYANIGATATIDVQTRLLTVNVQVYYTASPPTSSNRIHVALLQNNLEGPQTGSPTFNPDDILPNGNYLHQHVLREMLTGISGSVISPISMGTTIDRTYTYTIPAHYRDIPVVLADLTLAVYLTQTTQEIINGHEIIPAFTNFPSAINSKVVEAAVRDTPLCGFTASPTVRIQNFGNQPLTSLYIDYSINNSPVKTFYWTGSLPPIRETEITLDDINFFPSATNTLTVNTRLPNNEQDGDTGDDGITLTFASAPDVEGTITMSLQLDDYGSEVSWKVVNASGDILYQSTPYADNNPALITKTFNLPSGDCYAFVIRDAYGDGLLGSSAGFTLEDANNYAIISDYADYGSGAEIWFGVDAPQPDSSDVFYTGIAGADTGQAISIFPNPASGRLSLALKGFENHAAISICSVLGERLKFFKTENIRESISLDTSDLPEGVYFVTVETGDKRFTEKIIITF
ncbi:MAG TPA: Omp28-related outer membrane protein [Chitinophagales bacterium]|nr:Omp28-related outer membrane protein [Chitinophagales bacterium]